MHVPIVDGQVQKERRVYTETHGHIGYARSDGLTTRALVIEIMGFLPFDLVMLTNDS